MIHARNADHGASEPNSSSQPEARGANRNDGNCASLDFDSANLGNDLESQQPNLSPFLLRVETQESQHAETVGQATSSQDSLDEKPLPPFGGGKPYPLPLKNWDDYLVDFNGPDDPSFAINWKLHRKLYMSLILALTSTCSTFDSAIFSSSSPSISKTFHVGLEVATLSSTLYILGYAFGPLIWAPLSELQGRRLPMLIGMFGFSIFNTAVAVSKDLQTLLICRFFSGVFGSCPLALVVAVFSDMYANQTRGVAIAVFTVTVFLGPMLAPLVGGFINTSYLGWRWTAYVPAIWGYTAFACNALFIHESYPPAILMAKAAELRRRTKNWAIHSRQDEVEINLKQLFKNNFSRPLRLLITEPLMAAVTVYMSFIFGLLYCFLTSYSIVFGQIHGMTPGVAGSTLIGMVVGLLIASPYIIYASNSYNKKLEANNGLIIPEWRLQPVIVGGLCFTIGLFWFAWTSFTPDIPWIVPTLSGLFTGFGILVIFIQLLNYLVDTYLIFAASAVAANTFCRSLMAASFPLFSRQMYENMGVQWAGTLIGCVSAVMLPIPVIFLLYGKKLRSKSKFAPTS